MRGLSLAVVGADHPNKRGPTRRFAITLCRPGDPVHLVPEPSNPKDPSAIQVFSVEGALMGYVSAERAPWVGMLLRDGRIAGAIFQEATPYGAVIRVGLDGEPPTLPLARPAARGHDESGFWPDEPPADE